MINRTCDVLVVGGGIAGMSAAVAAARGGADTHLVEKRPGLGGILAAGLGFPICGLFDSYGLPLNGGVSRELIDELGAAPRRMGRLHVLDDESGCVQAFFSSAVESQHGVAVSTACKMMGVTQSGGRIDVVSTSEGDVSPKVVIDCSGSGDVMGACAGATLPAERAVLAGCTVRLDGVEWDGMLPVKVSYILRRAELPDGLSFSAYMRPNCLKLALRPDIHEDEIDSAAELVLTTLAASLPEFQSANVRERSPYLLQREERRLRGEYILRPGDVLSCRRFPDAIAKSVWPIELWSAEHGQQMGYLPDGTFYEIPLRALRSESVGNLFAAGRCISAASKALASARVMGTCIATGEAAGIEAAAQCS